MKAKRVLVFGTFDGLHPGHLFFLRSAKAQGTTLIVAVARDAHVQLLKEKRPVNPETKRLAVIKQLTFVNEVYLCDEELGTYAISTVAKPDLIVLGHDQQALEKDLIRWMADTDQYVPMFHIQKV